MKITQIEIESKEIFEGVDKATHTKSIHIYIEDNYFY